MNALHEVADRIARNATAEDITAAREVQDALHTGGPDAAFDTKGASHLINCYQLNNGLFTITRWIVRHAKEAR